MIMKNKLTTTLVVALGALALAANAQDNNNPPNDGPPPGAPAQRGPGVAGQRPQPGFHLLPPRAQDQLNLTDDQKKQIAALEAETKAKLEKILTPDQLAQLKNMRPPMQGGQGGPQMRGGRGQGPGNGPGGDGNMPPNGPPPGEGDGNNPPPGGPPGAN
jgi:hypothetical protein